ncbi:MAG TPA: methyl-accepting chemotaxis protein, partial [Candidatus Paceibacterota bacterium]|nr:methyl-accepting chemotaxis protein [Candidatus Paceibacterota bacterium]
AGMGFSVVADEVRSLAQKSAMAARETTEKIEASMGRTDEGVRVSGQLNASLEVVEHKAGQVEQQLQNILARSREVDGLIADISSASAEQSQGISQVTQAVAQIDQVVQRTAANAEESAGAAEELQSQVLSQKEVIGRLQRLVTGQNENRDQTYPSKAPVPEQKTQTLREPKRIIRTPALAMSTRQGD